MQRARPPTRSARSSRMRRSARRASRRIASMPCCWVVIRAFGCDARGPRKFPRLERRWTSVANGPPSRAYAGPARAIPGVPRSERWYGHASGRVPSFGCALRAVGPAPSAPGPQAGMPFGLSARRLLRRDLRRVRPSGCRPGAFCAGTSGGYALRAVGPPSAGPQVGYALRAVGPPSAGPQRATNAASSAAARRPRRGRPRPTRRARVASARSEAR